MNEDDREFDESSTEQVNWVLYRISSQLHTTLKQRSNKGNLLFLLWFFLCKNCVHIEEWGFVEILPSVNLACW